MRAINIISDALAEIGVIGAGDAPTAADTEFALRKLNQITQRWANGSLFMNELLTVSFSTTGAASYTIGPSGDVVNIRPIKVNAASEIDANGLEQPVSVVSQDQWSSIPTKNETGPASVVWYEGTNTNGTIHVYPKTTGTTLNLRCLALVTEFPDTATDVYAPEGYETAFTLTLAEDIAPAFGVQVQPSTVSRARAARKTIKSSNLDPLLLEMPLAECETFDIVRGY